MSICEVANVKTKGCIVFYPSHFSFHHSQPSREHNTRDPVSFYEKRSIFDRPPFSKFGWNVNCEGGGYGIGEIRDGKNDHVTAIFPPFFAFTRTAKMTT